MARCAHEADHALIRQRQMPALVVGVQADDVERIELAICADCHTSIGRPCEDARHMEASSGSGTSLCGTAFKAILVDTYQQSDCPSCHAIVDAAK